MFLGEAFKMSLEGVEDNMRSTKGPEATYPIRPKPKHHVSDCQRQSTRYHQPASIAVQAQPP